MIEEKDRTLVEELYFLHGIGFSALWSGKWGNGRNTPTKKHNSSQNQEVRCIPFIHVHNSDEIKKRAQQIIWKREHARV